jgi:pantoate kinase
VAESRNASDTQQDEENTNGSRGMGTAVMSATQDAAEMARVTAQRAAERLPEAVAGVQGAATETQRRLDELPNEGLIVGTSFSLGLGVGLFLSGANRFLILGALAPAAAMALTMFGRQQADSATSATPIGNRRASSRATTSNE